jgi:hypothetical protein
VTEVDNEFTRLIVFENIPKLISTFLLRTYECIRKHIIFMIKVIDENVQDLKLLLMLNYNEFHPNEYHQKRNTIQEKS